MWDNTPEKVYFSTYNGKFTREVPEGTPGASSRIAEKSGRKITALSYNRLIGKITGISYRKHEHEGKIYRNVAIDMTSASGEFRLELNVFSTAARCFFHTMESIVPEKEVELRIKRTDKRDSLFVSQLNEAAKFTALKWNYTKDNPGGRPAWVKKVNDMGEEQWDNTAEIAWFLEKIPELNKKFRDADIFIENEPHVSDEAIPESTPVPETPEPANDLPF